MGGNSRAKFSLYRKKTNKDDFIHYLSRHSARTRSGLVILLCVQAIRICSKEFVAEEMARVTTTFHKLMCPLDLLRKLEKRAVAISKATPGKDKRNDYFIVPYSRGAEIMTNC